jgi:hypothetical protein
MALGSSLLIMKILLRGIPTCVFAFFLTGACFLVGVLKLNLLIGQN